MGLDKEATDIWKFGIPRPDLSTEETFAAPYPETLSQEEADRRDILARETLEAKTKPLIMALRMGFVARKLSPK